MLQRASLFDFLGPGSVSNRKSETSSIPVTPRQTTSAPSCVTFPTLGRSTSTTTQLFRTPTVVPSLVISNCSTPVNLSRELATPRLLRHLSEPTTPTSFSVPSTTSSAQLTPSTATILSGCPSALWNVSQDENYKRAHLVTRPPPPVAPELHARALHALFSWPQVTLENVHSFGRPKLDASLVTTNTALFPEKKLRCVAKSVKLGGQCILMPSPRDRMDQSHDNDDKDVSGPKMDPGRAWIVCEYLEQRPILLHDHMTSCITNYKRVAARQPRSGLNTPRPKQVSTATPPSSSRSYTSQSTPSHGTPTSSNRLSNTVVQHPCVTREVVLEHQEVGPLMMHLSGDQISDTVVLENDLFAAPIAFHDTTEDDLVMILTLEATPSFDGSVNHFNSQSDSSSGHKRKKRHIDIVSEDEQQDDVLVHQYGGVTHHYAALEEHQTYTLTCTVEPLRCKVAVGQVESKHIVPRPRSKIGKELTMKIVQFLICRLIRRKIEEREWRQKQQTVRELARKRHQYATVRGAREVDQLKRAAAADLEHIRHRPRRAAAEAANSRGYMDSDDSVNSRMRSSSGSNRGKNHDDNGKFGESEEGEELISIWEHELLDIFSRDKERALIQRAMDTCGVFTDVNHVATPFASNNGGNNSGSNYRRRVWNEDEDALLEAEQLCTHEDMCIYFTMEEAWVRLQQAGIHCPTDPALVESIVHRFRDKSAVAYGHYLLHHLSLTPWHQTYSYHAFRRGLGRVRLTGLGNPFPNDYGYSMLSVRLRARGRKQRTAKRQRRQQRSVSDQMRLGADSAEDDSDVENWDTCLEVRLIDTQ